MLMELESGNNNQHAVTCKESAAGEKKDARIYSGLNPLGQKTTMTPTCQICILIRTVSLAPWRCQERELIRADVPERYISTSHSSARYSRRRSMQTNNHVTVSNSQFQGRPGVEECEPLLILHLSFCMFRKSTLLLRHSQDYAFTAQQILLLPPAIEDIDLCMKEGCVCKSTEQVCANTIVSALLLKMQYYQGHGKSINCPLICVEHQWSNHVAGNMKPYLNIWYYNKNTQKLYKQKVNVAVVESIICENNGCDRLTFSSV